VWSFSSDYHATFEAKTEGTKVRLRASDLPLAQAEPAAIAFIIGVDGPSYRPVGAAMVLGLDGGVHGSLSSGCIDADVVHHAAEVAASAIPRTLRYGAGSPFRDFELPCGGGLDIRVIPAPAAGFLASLRADLAARRPVSLWLGEGVGSLQAGPCDLLMHVEPDPRFAVFGKLKLQRPESRAVDQSETIARPT